MSFGPPRREGRSRSCAVHHRVLHGLGRPNSRRLLEALDVWGMAEFGAQSGQSAEIVADSRGQPRSDSYVLTVPNAKSPAGNSGHHWCLAIRDVLSYWLSYSQRSLPRMLVPRLLRREAMRRAITDPFIPLYFSVAAPKDASTAVAETAEFRQFS